MTGIAKRTDPSFRLRLPKDVLRGISARAKKNGRSRNSEIVVVLSQYVEQQKTPPENNKAAQQ